MNLRDMRPASTGWHAHLELGYAARGDSTVLAHRRHLGPLLVQKPFYPEGERVCHSTLIHPPGGIAGGDRLRLDVTVGDGAHAVITTPGAAKWYRSNASCSEQHNELSVANNAMLEWLPQPSIVFDGALVAQTQRVRLQRNARYIGWDILCFGRVARGERFASGQFRTGTEIVDVDGTRWTDRAVIDGGGALLSSPAGLGGAPVSGVFLAAGIAIDRDLIERCRQIVAPAHSGVTSLPSILVARFVGESAEAAMRYFIALWELVRPALMGRVACAPRIWQT